MAYAAIWISWLQWVNVPSRVFANEFGFDPPPTVEFHNEDSWEFRDSGRTYLYFKADELTVQRIVAGWRPGRGLNSSNLEPPHWWRPRLKNARQYSLGGFDRAKLPVNKGFHSQER